MDFNLSLSGIWVWVVTPILIFIFCIGIVASFDKISNLYHNKKMNYETSFLDKDIEKNTIQKEKIRIAILYAKKDGKDQELIDSLEEKYNEINLRLLHFYHSRDIKKYGEDYNPDYDALLNDQ